MECLDLSKVTCRICITGDEYDEKSNLFTKKINETSGDAMKSIDDDYVLNMRLSDALQSYTCIQLQEDRGLPETICRKCEFQLLETLSFIHRTNDTQQILNSYANTNQETKVKIEDIDINEDSSYTIEALNDAGEVVEGQQTIISIPSVESNDNNEQISDYDAEDAVSFLKSVKRGNLETDTYEPCKQEDSENYSCNYCQKTFLRKFNLVEHMRLHVNLRPYKCTHCSKSFAQSGNLNSHLRTHVTKLKPMLKPSETPYDLLSKSTKARNITARKSTSKLVEPSNQCTNLASNVSSECSASSTFQGLRSANANLNYGTPSDDTLKSIQAKRRTPKIKRIWQLDQRFKSGDDAKDFVKSERIWSISTTNRTTEGMKVLYRCKKAKVAGRQCECAIYLLYLLESDAVLLYRTENEHTCHSNPSTYKPIPDELRQKIVSMFEFGIRKRQQIERKLASENIEIPSTNRLNQLIQQCRKKHNKLWTTGVRIRSSSWKIDDSMLKNETIDSYHSSTASDSSFAQRRKKVSKQWVKVKEFPSFVEAAQEIKKENIWSKYCTNTSMSETSVIYRCNKVKARGEQCKAGRRIAISKSTEAITLYKSQNEHTCDKINDIHLSVRAPIPENVKKIVEEWFEKGLKYKQIRVELIKLKLPLPSDSKLKTYLKELRLEKMGLSTLSFRELFDKLTSLSDIPESPNKAYVVDFHIDKQEHKNFRFFATSKTLLQNALYAKLICTDTKCKLMWQGFPVQCMYLVLLI